MDIEVLIHHHPWVGHKELRPCDHQEVFMSPNALGLNQANKESWWVQYLGKYYLIFCKSTFFLLFVLLLFLLCFFLQVHTW